MNERAVQVGTVASLWCFPVKSMLGNDYPALEFEHRGVKRDRSLAVVDAYGKLGSHKPTRRFTRIPGLFNFNASVRHGLVSIDFPDGQALASDDPHIDRTLSEALAQPVSLRPEAATAHHDEGPVHIVTTASMRWLQQLLPAAQIDARRFRPNIVLDVDGASPVEQTWIGRSIQVGAVTLRIVSPTERCVMTTLAQADLGGDKTILRALASNADALFGIYARVLMPGKIAHGDAASLTE